MNNNTAARLAEMTSVALLGIFAVWWLQGQPQPPQPFEGPTPSPSADPVLTVHAAKTVTPHAVVMGPLLAQADREQNAFVSREAAVAVFRNGRALIAIHDKEETSFPDAMVQMWPSGRIEFSADYRTPHAPAEAFWSAVAQLRMGDCGPLAYRALLAHGRAEQDVARSLRDLTAASAAWTVGTAWQPPRGDLIDQANDLGSRALACLRSVGITP